jgi:hypothetical protein
VSCGRLACWRRDSHQQLPPPLLANTSWMDFSISSCQSKLEPLVPANLNQMANVVNSVIGFLLPFAFTPLVKYNCSQAFLGEFAARGWERWLLYIFAVAVYFINAYSLSARGGGFFGSFVPDMEEGVTKTVYIGVQVLAQLFYFGWNAHCILTPVSMAPIQEARPLDPQQFAPKRGTRITTKP